MQGVQCSRLYRVLRVSRVGRGVSTRRGSERNAHGMVPGVLECPFKGEGEIVKNPMTVKQLRDILWQEPDDAEIVVYSSYLGYDFGISEACYDRTKGWFGIEVRPRPVKGED